MIKVYSSKNGGVFIEEELIKNSFISIISDYINVSNLHDVTFEIKRNLLKFINIHLSKDTIISETEEINLHNQLLFFLSNKFQITNAIITFFYEN